MRVFLSHAWIDGSPARVADNPRRGLVRQLRDALRAEGADVFFDEDEIAKLDDIRARVTDALASSTLLVCWYSNAYRTRRACHWELLTGITTDSSRVVVVNPEPTVDHVLPASLRDVLIPAVPDRDDVAAWKELARGIVRLAREKDGVFGRLRPTPRGGTATLPRGSRASSAARSRSGSSTASCDRRIS